MLPLMSNLTQRRILIAVGLIALLALFWWIGRNPGSDPVPESAAAGGGAVPEEPAAPRAADLPGSGSLRVTRTNPVKAALRNTTWKIVARQEGGDPADSGEPDGARKEATTTQGQGSPGVSSTRLSLEFVRANFDAAGMRGVERFAAFSPPQFAAIKQALEKHDETSISAAPDEFAPDGETVYYDLVNAEDDRQFAIEFTPRPEAGKKTLRLRIATAGNTRRRDTVLPIWDGQTVMVPLAPSSDRRGRLALFITVRLLAEDGEPVNEFLVWE